MKIPIAKTVFTESEYKTILEPLKSGWVVQGPFVKEFEDKWCDFTSAKHAIATSNCTTALHLSLAALGIGPGDEVIIPAFTWVATANAVETTGATPVFCDIDLSTFNIQVNQIEPLISKKTKVIIPVHLFGLAADMGPILNIARKHGLYIVEDAACGFASRYKSKHVGNFGHTGCFSFHPRKAITTGEGGMVVTNDNVLAEKLRSMRDHGASISDLQRHQGTKPYLLPEFANLGFNYRMTDIQASIGSTQMDRANSIEESRKKWADEYDNQLEDIDWLQKPFRGDDYQHGYQSYVCLFQPERIASNNVEIVYQARNRFMDYLFEEGISTRPGTHAVHMLAYYRKKYHLKESDCPNTWIADHCSISFPIFPALSEEEFNLIISAIHAYAI